MHNVYFVQFDAPVSFKTLYPIPGWQKLRGRTGGTRRKVWTRSDKNFKPEHTLFCRQFRFVAIYALFGDLWAKTVFLWHISLSKFCNFAITRKKDAFDAKIVNTRLTKICIAIFAPDERLPSSATL